LLPAIDELGFTVRPENHERQRPAELQRATLIPSWPRPFSRQLIVDCDASGAPRSGQRPTANPHQRIVPQAVEVDRILMPARDRRGPRYHHLEHRMPDAVRIAAIRPRNSPAHTKLAFRLAQQQKASIARLLPTIKIDCEFLAVHRWQVEWKQRIVGHSACGGGLICEPTLSEQQFATRIGCFAPQSP
jgi:hypothetical protein